MDKKDVQTTVGANHLVLGSLASQQQAVRHWDIASRSDMLSTRGNRLKRSERNSTNNFEASTDSKIETDPGHIAISTVLLHSKPHERSQMNSSANHRIISTSQT